MDPTLIAYVTAVIFVASLVKGVFGFGDALMAMPLLLLAVDPALAAPTVALTGLIISVVIAAQTWDQIAWRSAWRLVVAAAVGVPVGVVSLRLLPADAIRTLLGVILIVYGAWALLRPLPRTPIHRRWAIPFGFASGWLGGAVTTPGPPVVVYAALRRWEPDRVRGTLQAFFLPVTVVMVAGHALAGLWTRQVGVLLGLSVAPVLLATFVGGRLARRVRTERFNKLLLAILVVLGALLVAR